LCIAGTLLLALVAALLGRRVRREIDFMRALSGG
jgi:hypothetical protein